ncbi:MAG: hypothetical protein K6E41_00825 [Solobacterium sp.]|nr:hypothetical protein [Solobacterium sp.]
MALYVRLTQYDLMENQEKVIARGEARWKDDQLFYWEDPEHTIMHHIRFGKDSIIIGRSADVRSMTKLYFGKAGSAQVFSEYGMMQFETELIEYIYNADCRSVEYKVYLGSEPVSHQRMVWELEEDPDE